MTQAQQQGTGNKANGSKGTGNKANGGQSRFTIQTLEPIEVKKGMFGYDLGPNQMVVSVSDRDAQQKAIDDLAITAENLAIESEQLREQAAVKDREIAELKRQLKSAEWLSFRGSPYLRHPLNDAFEHTEDPYADRIIRVCLPTGFEFITPVHLPTTLGESIMIGDITRGYVVCIRRDQKRSLSHRGHNSLGYYVSLLVGDQSFDEVFFDEAQFEASLTGSGFDTIPILNGASLKMRSFTGDPEEVYRYVIEANNKRRLLSIAREREAQKAEAKQLAAQSVASAQQVPAPPAAQSVASAQQVPAPPADHPAPPAESKVETKPMRAQPAALKSERATIPPPGPASDGAGARPPGERDSEPPRIDEEALEEVHVPA